MDKLSGRILKNAQRLLDDAMLMKNHGRYATCVGLTVLSIEELGKFVLRQWESGEPELKILRRRVSYHRAKQAVLGALYNADTALDALTDFLERHGGKNFRLIPTEEAKVLGLLPVTEEQRSQKLEYHDGTEEYVAEHLAKSPKRNLTAYSLIGVLEKLKHLAFYVDEEETGEFANWHFDSQDADDMINDAKNAHYLLDNEVRLRMAKEIFKASLRHAVEADAPLKS